jgi:DNA polymerase-1
MKFCAVDFEFHSQNRERMNLVCMAIHTKDAPPFSIWLDNSPDGYTKAKEVINQLHLDDHVFLCYGASAEMRSFWSLGLDPRRYRFIDLFIEYFMLKNNNTPLEYGKIKKGDKIVTTKPKKHPKEDGQEKVGDGLVSACLNLLDVNIDSEHKTRMRDLILSKGPYTPDQQKQILDYCESDVSYLYAILKKIVSLNNIPTSKYIPEAIQRARFAAEMAVCESHGYPLNPERLFALTENQNSIHNRLCVAANETHPFYVQDKKGVFHFKYASFFEYVATKAGSIELAKWPLSPAGKLKTDDDTLSMYKKLPGIAALQNTRKLHNQIKWFRPDAMPDFCSRLGSDFRLRGWLKPFGTQTGRNAPPAKSFVLAMSSWLRCLIEPEPGWAITGIDWANQEFAIAAILSNDRNMLTAYKSGDPYLYFAKKGGMVPQTATKESHPFERDLAKGVVLGLQFGLGAENMGIKISNDLGIKFSQDRAFELISLHKEVFPRYWEFLDEVADRYLSRPQPPLETMDGFCIYRAAAKEGKSLLSIKNFPMQANGGAVMRRAIIIASSQVQVLSPLHDAIYIYHRIEDTQKATKILSDAMHQAVKEVLQTDLIIRQDVKTIKHGEVWIEKKGGENYNLLKDYLTSDFWVLEAARYLNK